MSNALYLILRHRDDKTRKYRRPQYRNHWLDDERVKSISTTPHVANECRKEREKREILRFMGVTKVSKENRPFLLQSRARCG